MDDRGGSPAASTSSASVAVRRMQRREEDGGDRAACAGKSCQSCTAGVIADCVAVCCCPCGVVNILALAFVKLPWAVARKCIGGRKRRIRRRGTTEGIGGSSETETKMSSSVGGGGNGVLMVNDDFRAEDIWLEMCEVGHLGFGRVSFTGLPPFQDMGN